MTCLLLGQLFVVCSSLHHAQEALGLSLAWTVW